MCLSEQQTPACETHGGLVTSYDVVCLYWHRLMQWFVARQRQAIILTNAD